MPQKPGLRFVLADHGSELAGSFIPILAGLGFVIIAELFRISLGNAAKQKFGTKGESHGIQR